MRIMIISNRTGTREEKIQQMKSEIEQKKRERAEQILNWNGLNVLMLF